MRDTRAMTTSALRRLVRSDSGAATIEAVFWVPFFFFFMIVVADIAMIVYDHSRVLSIVEDVDRDYSIGIFTSEAAAAKEIEDRIAAANISSNAVAEVVDDDTMIMSRVSVPIADLDMVGLVSGVIDASVTAQSQQVREN